MKNASEALLLVVFLACAVGPACDLSSSSPRAEPSRPAAEDPMRCAGCHLADFSATTTPPHGGARPTACGACHTQSSWKEWRVSHPWWELTGAHAKAAADVELVGAERQVKCYWCHRGDASSWRGTMTGCVHCHDEDRARSKFPGHARFPKTCDDCHSTTAWAPATRHIEAPPPELDAGAGAAPGDAGVRDGAAADAGRRIVHVPPRPTGTGTGTASTPPVVPTLVPTVVPTVDVISRPSRHR
jgi:hypothetical protein